MKKVVDIDLVLAKADKFYEKCNFQPALQQYQKVVKLSGREDIGDKIAVCKKELEKLSAKDMIKRARKNLKKKKIKPALDFFRKAYKITGENWLAEKIDELESRDQSNTAQNAAQSAEKKGEYLKAAQLYGQSAGDKGNNKFCNKMAECFVKAKKYKDAIAAYQTISINLDRDFYYYGFALAKEGNSFKCLKMWDKLINHYQGLTEQKKIIATQLILDILEQYKNNQDIGRIYEQALYIINFPGCDAEPWLKDLLEYARLKFIEKLWDKKDFESVANIIFNENPDSRFQLIKPEMITIGAKVGYHLYEKSGFSQNDFPMYWINSVYNHNNFKNDLKESEVIRKELLKKAEQKIKKKDSALSSKESQRALAWWDLEKKIITELKCLAENLGEGVENVCTPLYAARVSKSQEVLKWLNAHEDSFVDSEKWLETGSYFTPAIQALYLAKSGEYEKAFQEIALLKNNSDNNEFITFGINKVEFEYGMFLFENGASRLGRYFKTAGNFFSRALSYEKKFARMAMESEKTEDICKYEEILGVIHNSRPSKLINKAFSFVMTTRAIDLYNLDKLSLKAFNGLVKKALRFDPENEFAQATLENNKTQIQIVNLDNALGKHKISKACDIVINADNWEVERAFFDFMENIIDSADSHLTDNFTNLDKILLFNEILQGCEKVDSTHAMNDRIKMLIARID